MSWRTKDMWLVILAMLVMAALGLWGVLRQPQAPVTCTIYALDANRERVCICWSDEHCASRRPR